MKNHLLISIACLLLLQCSNGNEPGKKVEKKNDLLEMNLKGKVKSVFEISKESDNTISESDSSDFENGSIIKFNSKGYKIECNNFFEDDVLNDGKSLFKYDANDNLIELSWYKSDSSLYMRFTYRFDSKGNLIEECDYNTESKLDCRYTYKYNNKNYKVQEDWIDKDGDLYERTIFKHDNLGNQIEWDKSYPDGDLYEKSTSKYDRNRNEIENIYFKSDGRHLKNTYIYDSVGNIIEWNTYGYDGKHERRNIKKYDRNGNITEMYSYDSADKVLLRYISKYKFDKMGNWVQRIEFCDGIHTIITKRKIEYF